MDEGLKAHLIQREKAKLRKRSRPVLAAVLIIDLVAASMIIVETAGLLKTQLYSMREPDYAGYIIRITLMLAVILLTSFAWERYRKRLLRDITAKEALTGERAYISGGALVLESSAGSVSFDIRRIRSIRSEDGITSFDYYDPSGGITTFTFLDYYRPQVAVLLSKTALFR